MSYWVRLLDTSGQTCHVSKHSEGGTYVLGGTSEAELNITYNYSNQFAKVGLDFHEHAPLGRHGKIAVHGKRAGDLIPLLADAVKSLGTERHPDYWKSTPGNAGFALSILLDWARQHPDGVFEVH